MKIFIAPIAGVTDFAYRKILEKFNPDMIFCEMVSADAIFRCNEKTINEILKLRKGNSVQIFGKDVQTMTNAAKYIENLGTKHLDINVGCPMKKIVKNGYGAALLADIKQVEKIIKSIQKNTNLDLSIKIRIGYREYKNPLDFALLAQDLNLKHITIHGRTREQLYTGKADWDIIKNIKSKVKIPVIGNGDIFSPEIAKKQLEYSNVDGIMLARGIFGNPWLIKQIREFLKTGSYKIPSKNEKIKLMLEHINIACENKNEKNIIFELRKHIGWYLKGLENSITIKQQLSKITTKDKLIILLKNFCD